MSAAAKMAVKVLDSYISNNKNEFEWEHFLTMCFLKQKFGLELNDFDNSILWYEKVFNHQNVFSETIYVPKDSTNS